MNRFRWLKNITLPMAGLLIHGCGVLEGAVPDELTVIRGETVEAVALRYFSGGDPNSTFLKQIQQAKTENSDLYRRLFRSYIGLSAPDVESIERELADFIEITKKMNVQPPEPITYYRDHETTIKAPPEALIVLQRVEREAKAQVELNANDLFPASDHKR